MTSFYKYFQPVAIFVELKKNAFIKSTKTNTLFQMVSQRTILCSVDSLEFKKKNLQPFYCVLCPMFVGNRMFFLDLNIHYILIIFVLESIGRKKLNIFVQKPTSSTLPNCEIAKLTQRAVKTAEKRKLNVLQLSSKSFLMCWSKFFAITPITNLLLK